MSKNVPLEETCETGHNGGTTALEAATAAGHKDVAKWLGDSIKGQRRAKAKARLKRGGVMARIGVRMRDAEGVFFGPGDTSNEEVTRKVKSDMKVKSEDFVIGALIPGAGFSSSDDDDDDDDDDGASKNKGAPKGPAPNLCVVTISRARGLKAMDGGGLFGGKKTSDPYCRVTLGGIKLKTSTVKKSLEPEWNSTFEVEAREASQSVEFAVYDYDLVGADDLIGAFTATVGELSAAEGPQWHALGGDAAAHGEIEVAVTWRSGVQTATA